MTRTRTPDQRHADGSITITMQRSCNGCDTGLGDATEAEINAAITGQSLPDVRTECTECTPGVVADPQMEAAHYGIPVAQIGDDLEAMLALGHHSPRRALAAFNRHARTFLGWDNLADDRSESLEGWLEEIKQRWVVFRKDHPEQGAGLDFVWVAYWCDQDAPGARPVTLLVVA